MDDIHAKRNARYVILQVLAYSNRTWTPLSLLRRSMDVRNWALSYDQLNYHLDRVLEPLGLVEIKRVRDLPRELREIDRRASNEIDAVKLTPKGLNAVNEPDQPGLEEIEGI